MLLVQIMQRQPQREADILTEQALQARRAYKREWARRNRDKIREAENRYWERKAEEAAAAAAEQTAQRGKAGPE